MIISTIPRKTNDLLYRMGKLRASIPERADAIKLTKRLRACVFELYFVLGELEGHLKDDQHDLYVVKTDDIWELLLRLGDIRADMMALDVVQVRRPDNTVDPECWSLQALNQLAIYELNNAEEHFKLAKQWIRDRVFLAREHKKSDFDWSREMRRLVEHKQGLLDGYPEFIQQEMKAYRPNLESPVTVA